MATKLTEKTYGTHTFMRLRLSSGIVAAIDVYYTEDGEKYKTSFDHDPELRAEIIAAFNELF